MVKVIFIKPRDAVIFLLLLFVAINASSSYVIKNLNIDCIVNPDDTINETIKFVVYNNEDRNLTEISYTIPQSIKNFTITSSNGVKGYSALYNEGVTELDIEFNKPLSKGDSTNITINCIVRDAIWTKNGIKQLIMSFPISSNKAEIKIVLPPGAVILSPEGNLLVTPSGYKITTDGKHQIIIWDLSLNKEITFTITVKYTFISYPTHNIIEHPLVNENLKYLLIVVVIGAVIFAGLFIRERKLRKNNIKKLDDLNNEIASLKNTLSEKENQLKEKEIQLNEKIDEIRKLVSKIKDLEEKLASASKNLLSKDEIINILNEKIVDYESKIQRLLEENSTYKEKINALTKQIEDLTRENQHLKEKIINLSNIAKKYVEEKKGVLWDFLTEDEKIIIDLIKKHGHITQKEIVEMTGMSKPKVSRIVSELEDRKIIRKEKIGRINKLTLTDESKKLL
ncbi:transcriptional regulator, MarR family [Methanocaldococcus vulcanius M7]|uniref:Transcriptional regulator, MarR family n=1 Tax=Methanocaldococcus vulcanius (strain ATCC 700851 / DSM 12094 / M7) TaxID=579137 RepID=C9RGG2_METVM|nr:MarR family transcriptional regulator [Methanocaldococcus vulcanius]ACX72664.1 transcriptional regulator, MarR family [Methanocaldococcus vulcanius M7]